MKIMIALTQIHYKKKRSCCKEKHDKCFVFVTILSDLYEIKEHLTNYILVLKYPERSF